MKITAPCVRGNTLCVLSYSLEDIAWECTICKTLFEVPDGDVRITDGRHVDWHKDEVADVVMATLSLPSFGGMG